MGYEQTDITFYMLRPTMHEGVNEGINEGINDEMQRKLALVIGTIHDYPGIKIPAIEQRTDIPKKTLERYMSLLKSWKIIEFRGAKKTGGYYIKTDSEPVEPKRIEDSE